MPRRSSYLVGVGASSDKQANPNQAGVGSVYDPPFYLSSGKNSLALLGTLVRVKGKMSDCSKLFRSYRCNSCGKKFHKALYTCDLPYCWECRDQRFAKYYSRLMDKDIRTRRMFHFSIGFKPIPIGHTPDFKHHQKVLQRWTRKVRKMGYNIRGCRVLDVAIRFDRDGGVAFWHYHFALLPEIGFKSCASDFNQAIDWASRGELTNVNVIGYRSKGSLFYYIAKRQASIFGHQNDKTLNPEGHYGYKDFVDLVDYVQHFHKSRKLIWQGSPIGLVYNTAPDSSIKCPFCGSDDTTELGIVDYWEVKGCDPPPRLSDQYDKNRLEVFFGSGKKKTS